MIYLDLLFFNFWDWKENNLVTLFKIFCINQIINKIYTKENKKITHVHKLNYVILSHNLFTYLDIYSIINFDSYNEKYTI